MKNYDWTSELKPLYEKAIDLYRSGNTELESYFTPAEIAQLASIGLRPINVYDYAEDFVKHGEPGWETFALVAAARRDYFLYHQKGKTAESVTSAEELPAKTDSLEGIEWLPRIIRKAECFLQGGLCHDIMFGCGGDRRFLKEHDLHPADFLRIVWASHGEPSKIVSFLKPK